jgi:UDP-N-acetylmuramoyl-L-alanyl-D-glutamate--2,6-diaminopimelate ligase
VRGALDSARPIPGRLQRAEQAGKPISVFVDYAHTDDALENVLTALRPLTSGRLWCVFGCGGDRDRGKRPRMASVALQHADRVVVTSDNPRTEHPMRIIHDVLSGFGGDLERVTVEADRLRAIHATLQGAAQGDVVLIAGKGHEDYQIVGMDRLHFDDIEAVESFFDARVTEASAKGLAPLNQ